MAVSQRYLKKPKTISEDIPHYTDDDFSNIKILRDSFVMGFFGERGMGKGVAAAYFAYLEKQNNPERSVFYFPAEYQLSFGEPLTTEDMMAFPEKMFNSLVIIDEAQILLTKFRAAAYSNRTVIAFLQQIRKRGCRLLYTTNSPNQLDQGIAEQTDFHAFCKKYTDPRCIEAGREFHLKDCRDAIAMRITDTQGKYGRTTAHADGRKRFYRRITRALQTYSWFNTGAILSAMEVASMTKSRMMEAHENKDAGMSYARFVIELKDSIIPQMVNQGISIVYPRQFSETLKKDLDIVATADRIGRALKELGCQSKRQSAGMVYMLPSKKDLENWKAGMA